MLCSLLVLASLSPLTQSRGAGRIYPPPANPTPLASVFLTRPTDTAITATLHPTSAGTAQIAVTDPTGNITRFPAQPIAISPAKPQSFLLQNLKSNTTYSYTLEITPANTNTPKTATTGQFSTQRAPGSTFTFMVQGDSHPERNPKMNVPALYERTLNTAAAEKPDFYICMGDDFSIDNLREVNRDTIRTSYTRQVPYLGLIAKTAALFLVNGNHEQAARINLDGTPNSPAVIAQVTRNSFFPQPEPNSFYTGNSEEVEHIGKLQDYFAWTWGDALFVVIDPYWHSPVAVDTTFGERNNQARDMWSITLGKTQYDWLRDTLANSKSKFKFVFSHHVLGTGRGGIEQAPYYEWGGKDRSGRDEFSARRPGWEAPIHQLLVRYGVTAFFQGHDHIFARQVLDGITYQTTPTPADASGELLNGDAYRSGDKRAGAGYVRVSVTSTEAKVSFIRCLLPNQETDTLKSGQVDFSYTLKPRTQSQ